MYNPSPSVTRLAVCRWQIAVSVSEGSLAISVTSLVRQQGGSGARPRLEAPVWTAGPLPQGSEPLAGAVSFACGIREGLSEHRLTAV